MTHQFHDRTSTMKLAAILIAFAVTEPAQAMTHFLVAQWYQNASQMCKYDNGTVLNVGINLCPLTIED